MFDIGFPELVVISVVALLVIGPEKLPETIRTISLWIGRIQRSFSNIRNEIENELGADEIRRQLHNEKIMEELEQTRDTIKSVGQDMKDTIRSAETEARQLEGDAQPEAIQTSDAQTTATDKKVSSES